MHAGKSSSVVIVTTSDFIRHGWVQIKVIASVYYDA